jgi:trans-2,3-dihydro-3-hydroxyanthranilate isomerase
MKQQPETASLPNWQFGHPNRPIRKWPIYRGWMIPVQHWRVFPSGAHGGNPCPLVTDARELTAGQMRAVAAHYGHESAFVTSVSGSRVTLRYFVPRHEMRMCAHATIAAVTALTSSGVLSGRHASISTASGEHQVTWNGGDPPEVTVAQLPPWFGPDAAVHAELATALGLPRGSISPAAVIQPVSVSRAKLIVPLRDAAAVHAVRPDYPALWELCSRLDTTGAYVFADHPDGDPGHLVARQFPVDAGYPEDPATGVAAAALAAYQAGQRRPARPSWTRITIDQGDAMGQPSRLHAAAVAGPDGVTRPSVTGRAILISQDELSLSSLGDDLPEPELR